MSAERVAIEPAAAEALVSEYLACHGTANLEGVVALFADEASVEDPVGSAPRIGLDAIRAFYRETHARNGRLEFERIGPVLVGGNELVVHVRARLARRPESAAMDVIYALRLDAAGRIEWLRAWF